MFDDIEETLERELRDVADGVRVPAMPTLPPLPHERAAARRHWQPLLGAAAVVLVVAGAAVLTTRDGQTVDPAVPTPTPTPSAVSIPRTAPALPYVLDQRLYVDGEQVPGDWWSVQGGDAGWIAIRTDGTWWWGRGAEANALTGGYDAPPVISPNGEYVAELRLENGDGLLTGFDTRPDGEGLGGVPIDLGNRQDGSAVTIRAVTDDGRVIAQGTRTSLLWLPLVGDGTDSIDLAASAPGQVVLGSTPAGLVVTDEDSGEPYLAELSDTGELTPTGTVPAHDDLVVSPGGEWLAWAPLGTLGGEVTALPTLEAQSVDGDGRTTLTAPDGWGFRVMDWVWEDDRFLVSPVVGDAGERMARCSVQPARCVLIDGR